MMMSKGYVGRIEQLTVEKHMETVKGLAEISAWKGVAVELYDLLADIRDRAYLIESSSMSPEDVLESIYEDAARHLKELGPKAGWR
jgi:hypothetical protein